MRINFRLFTFILLSGWILPGPFCTVVLGQTGRGKIIDSETGFVIPFVKIQQNEKEIFTAYDGEFYFDPGTELHVTHPLYEEKTVAVEPGDTSVLIKLNYHPPEGNEESEKKALRVVKFFQKYSEKNNPENLKSYEYLTSNYINILKRRRNSDTAKWTEVRSLKLLEKNRYKYHDKYFHKILRSKFTDGDTSNIKYLPVTLYNLSPYQEFIRIGELDYLNPLYPTAVKKYDYSEVETFIYNDIKFHVLYVRAKQKKHFLSLRGLYYIPENNYGLAAAVFTTVPLKLEYAQCVVTNQLTEKNIWLGENLYVEAIFEHEPKYSEDAKMIERSTNSSINFNIDDQSSKKWLNMILFGQKDTKFSEESWSMDEMKLGNREKLSYIEKDTLNKGFVRKDWTQWIYDIYMGRLAFRLPYVYIKNILSINRYEYLRLGVGLQTHKQFSDIFTLGGYAGYGFKDKQFKYGGNVGFYLGRMRSTIISYEVSKDLLEPGRTFYIEEQKNYLRNFFSKHMDNIRSQNIRFKSVVNRKVDMGVSLKSFNLQPTYDYTFKPLAERGQDTTRMYFTELLFQARFGNANTFNKNARKLFYPSRSVFSNLFVNVARGYKNVLNGDFHYWKANARLFIFIDIGQQGKLDIMMESGIMTPNQPYQINYIAPGNDVELAGIIIKNAFQTMDLYRFVSDRYLNGFFEYDFGSIFFKKTKFDPHLALELNMGWGVFSGNPAYHRGVEIHDYGTGFYEAGVSLNNLLKAKIYNLIYGGLGLGVYYSLKTPDGNSKLAVRLTYTLGAL